MISDDNGLMGVSRNIKKMMEGVYAKSFPFGYDHIATKINRSFAYSDITKQFREAEQIRNQTLQAVFGAGNMMSKIMNPLNTANRASGFVNPAILGVSSQMDKFYQCPYFQATDFQKMVEEVNERYLGLSKLFTKQLAISEDLTRKYFQSSHFAIPGWVDKMSSSVRSATIENLSYFDILSATTLSNIERSFPSGGEEIEMGDSETEDPEKSFNKIKELLDENKALKAELEYVHTSFARNIANKLLRKSRRKLKSKDLKETSVLITEMIHKHLFKDSQISLQTVYTFIRVLKFVFEVIIIGLFMEGRGAQIFDSICGEDSKIEQFAARGVRSLNMIDTFSQVTIDFTIKNCSVYLRNSLKTRCVGKIKLNTNVIIYREKGDWCLVEGVITKYNKKKLVEQVKRGWVLKENLSSFQK